MGRRECVGPAAAQADDAEALEPEAVDQRLDVGGEPGHGLVPVIRRQPDAGTFDPHDAQAEVDGGGACQRRHLVAGARRAVEPQHREAVGDAVLGEAEAPSVVERDGAVQARFQEPHAGRLAQPVPSGRCPT